MARIPSGPFANQAIKAFLLKRTLLSLVEPQGSPAPREGPKLLNCQCWANALAWRELPLLRSTNLAFIPNVPEVHVPWCGASVSDSHSLRFRDLSWVLAPSFVACVAGLQ
jgi:hypothetical protein